MHLYAVVCFLNENGEDGESASEVPSCWLSQDQKQCWWPNAKNVGPHIVKRTIPDETDKKWQLHDVKCLGFYDNILSARQKADGLSSCDEASAAPERLIQTQKKSTLVIIKEEKNCQVGKGKRKVSSLQKKKQDDYSASDESDISDPNGIPDPPNLTEIMNKVMNPENAISNKKSSGITVTSDVLVSMNLNPMKDTPSTSRQGKDERPSSSHIENDLNDTNSNFMSLPVIDASMKDFFVDNKSIMLQLENLTIVVKDLCEKMGEKLGELTFAIRSVENRLDGIERVVNLNQLPTHANAHEDLAALLPLKTIEEVKEFESHLTVGDVRIRLVSYLAQIGGNSAKDCINRILKKVFGPEAAKKSSWCGLRGNFKVGDLTIIDAIKEAVKRSYVCTDKFFEDEGKEWFRQGSQKFARHQKKNLPAENI